MAKCLIIVLFSIISMAGFLAGAQLTCPPSGDFGTCAITCSYPGQCTDDNNQSGTCCRTACGGTYCYTG